MIDWLKVREAAENIVESLNAGKHGKSNWADCLTTEVPDIREYSGFDVTISGYISTLKENSRAYTDNANEAAWTTAYVVTQLIIGYAEVRKSQK